MRQIRKGERYQLSDLFNGNQQPEFTVSVNVNNSGLPINSIDISAFCLNDQKKMAGEKACVLFSNFTSLNNEICLVNQNTNTFKISVPNIIKAGSRYKSIVICAAIDSSVFAGTFNQIRSIDLTIEYQGMVIGGCTIDSSSVGNEKALTLVEFYEKGGIWRMTNVSQGFNGGLPELVVYYGGTVADDHSTQNQAHNQNNGYNPNQFPNNGYNPNQAQNNGYNPNQAQNNGYNPNQAHNNGYNPNQFQNNGYNPNQFQNNGYNPNQFQNNGYNPNSGYSSNQNQGNIVSLKKQKVLDGFGKKAPQLVSLAKKSLETLEKKNILGIRAKVALVLDASGSMNAQYKRGDVQMIVDRLMPLAEAFDDDGSFECWAFADKTQQLIDVNLDNLGGYIDRANGGWRRWDVGSRVNNEVDALESVIRFYGRNNPENLPVFVLFISDGGVHSNRQIEQAIRQSTKYPIFWQFVGIGGYGYGILERLDTMAGREIDNCNFFSLNSINSLGDSEIYEYLLNEFPLWLVEARRLGLIR